MIDCTIRVVSGLLIFMCVNTIQHYVPPPDPCYQAKLCNHTWLQECGKEKNNSDIRIFFDECDRHEYNCDYRKYYEKVELSECDMQASEITTKTPVTPMSTTVSTKTYSVTPTITKVTTTITVPTTISPLSNCLLADICNHTWIPECAFENKTANKRLFIDDCDVWEFNCDHSKNYQIVNYSLCFKYNPCRTNDVSFQRMGDYKYVLKGRQMVYAPPLRHTAHETEFYLPPTLRPNLPPIMFHGIRRYTPEDKKKNIARGHTKAKLTTKHTKKKLPKKKLTTKKQALEWSTQRRTVVLKNVTVIKNGQMMHKVIKGFAPETDQDSDFLQ